MTLVSVCFTSLIEDNPQLVANNPGGPTHAHASTNNSSALNVVLYCTLHVFTSAPLLLACFYAPTNVLYHSSFLATL